MLFFPVLRANLYVLIYTFLLFICSCTSEKPTETSTWQQFYCRDEGNPAERLLLYRAKVPSRWERKDPTRLKSIVDSTKPNVEFIIPASSAEKPSVYLTVHTFPVETFEQRIAPEAQVNRWKQQFTELDVTSIQVQPQAHSGFTGLYFYAEGILSEKKQAILGYSMQMAPIHWNILQPKEKALFKQKQMASNYTIKAVGPYDSLKSCQQEIISFANSFELIEEIPSR